MEVLSHPERQSKHLIIHGKINFSVPCPPPYKRKVWEYNKANLAQINYKLDNIHWSNLFHDKSIDEMTQIFTEKFLEVMSRNTQNKVITCNDN